MKVEDLMQTDVLTVSPDDLVDRVFYLMYFEKIRHLPVIEKQRLIGIVSDRDLYKAIGPRSRRKRDVRRRPQFTRGERDAEADGQHGPPLPQAVTEREGNAPSCHRRDRRGCDPLARNPRGMFRGVASEVRQAENDRRGDRRDPRVR